MFAQYRQGGEGFALLPMHATERMRLWLLGALVILAGIFVLDSAIAVSFALRVEGVVAPMIAVGSVPITGLLIVALLNVPVGRLAVLPPVQDDEIDRIAAFLAETQLYRDPELTLVRFARRMGQPVRQVSRAINAATGASVSNYINEWRIEEAADPLHDTGRKIDDIAQAVGFMSCSNFYREFQCIHGISPSVFRKQSRGVDAGR